MQISSLFRGLDQCSAGYCQMWEAFLFLIWGKKKKALGGCLGFDTGWVVSVGLLPSCSNVPPGYCWNWGKARKDMLLLIGLILQQWLMQVFLWTERLSDQKFYLSLLRKQMGAIWFSFKMNNARLYTPVWVRSEHFFFLYKEEKLAFLGQKKIVQITEPLTCIHISNLFIYVMRYRLCIPGIEYLTALVGFVWRHSN